MAPGENEFDTPALEGQTDSESWINESEAQERFGLKPVPAFISLQCINTFNLLPILLLLHFPNPVLTLYPH